MILRHELLTAMRAAPEILPVLVRGLDDATLRRRPAPGEWAIVEVLGHLGDTEERALGRTRRMLREESPLLAAYDQAALAEEHRYIELDATHAIERFAALRAEHLAELERLDEAHWQRVGIHEEEGPISVELHAAHLAAEDANHLAQIARMIPA
jgi:hypothetical protein